MSEIRKFLDLLELPPGSDWNDVTSAYRELIKVWHPDRFVQDEKLKLRAEAKSKELNEAVRQLRKHFRRTQHMRRSAVNKAVAEEMANEVRTKPWVPPDSSKVFHSRRSEKYRSKVPPEVYAKLLRRQQRTDSLTRFGSWMIVVMCIVTVGTIGFPTSSKLDLPQLQTLLPTASSAVYRVIAPVQENMSANGWSVNSRSSLIQAATDCDVPKI